MDLDDTLFLGKNQRPTFFAGVPTWQFAFFPTLIAPNYLDLRVVMDICRASPAYAVFRVATAFNNQIDNLLRPAIFVDNDPTFANVLTDPSLIIARGHDLNSAGLNTVGSFVAQIAMPPLSDLTRLAGAGRRYITLGLEAFVPTADFVSGGMDAFFAPRPIESRPIHYPAGW